MNSTHAVFLQEAKVAARSLLDLLGAFTKQDALWNGSPSYSTQITQQVIDSRAELLDGGYTKAEIDDALYALTIIKGEITSHIASLSRLADLP